MSQPELCPKRVTLEDVLAINDAIREVLREAASQAQKLSRAAASDTTAHGL